MIGYIQLLHKMYLLGQELEIHYYSYANLKETITMI